MYFDFTFGLAVASRKNRDVPDVRSKSLTKRSLRFVGEINELYRLIHFCMIQSDFL